MQYIIGRRFASSSGPGVSVRWPAASGGPRVSAVKGTTTAAGSSSGAKAVRGQYARPRARPAPGSQAQRGRRINRLSNASQPAFSPGRPCPDCPQERDKPFPQQKP